MFKRVFSLTALIVMMFVAQACNFPSADRVTETVPPDAPSRTEAIEAPETEEPAPPAGPMDCGDDLGCFSDAAQNCELAYVLYSIPIDMFGVLITSTTYQEILGPEEGLCVFSIRTEDVSVEYSEEAIQQLLDSGLTQEQIEEQRVMAEEQALEVGLDEICRAEVENITAVIDEWAQGNFSMADWEDVECEGKVSDVE